MALKPREIKQRRKENVQKRVSSRYQRRYQERAEGKTPEQQQAIQERMFGRMQERLGGIQGANPFGAGYDASMMAQAPTWQRPPAGPLGADGAGGANAPQTGPGGVQPPVMPGPIPGRTPVEYDPNNPYGNQDPNTWDPNQESWADWTRRTNYNPGFGPTRMDPNWVPPNPFLPDLAAPLPGTPGWQPPWMQTQPQNPFQGGGNRQQNPFGGQGRY